MNEYTYFKDYNFKKRRNYIGASDIPTLALMNKKYGQTPLTLWETIKGYRKQFEGNERTKAGKELEPLVLKWGLEKLPFTKSFSETYYDYFLISRQRKLNAYLELFSFTECTHPERPYLKCHADLIYQENFIMEAKTTGFFGAKRQDDVNIGYDKDDMSANGIPSSVYLQIQTQMLCYDIPISYVSAMMDTGIHRLYGPIPAHKKTQEKILAIAQKFWEYVENDTPPKPETWSEVVHMFPNFDKESKTVIAGDKEEKIIEMKDRAKKLRKDKKEIKAELEDIKNAIGLMLGKNALLESVVGNSLAKAYDVTKKYVLIQKLKEEHPRKYKILLKDGFIYSSTSRQLRF